MNLISEVICVEEEAAAAAAVLKLKLKLKMIINPMISEVGGEYDEEDSVAALLHMGLVSLLNEEEVVAVLVLVLVLALVLVLRNVVMNLLPIEMVVEE
jgi:hypothetical protein